MASHPTTRQSLQPAHWHPHNSNNQHIVSWLEECIYTRSTDAQVWRTAQSIPLRKEALWLISLECRPNIVMRTENEAWKYLEFALNRQESCVRITQQYFKKPLQHEFWILYTNYLSEEGFGAPLCLELITRYIITDSTLLWIYRPEIHTTLWNIYAFIIRINSSPSKRHISYWNKAHSNTTLHDQVS